MFDPLALAYSLSSCSLHLAQSMAAAVACILPAASYNDGDSTVGVLAG